MSLRKPLLQKREHGDMTSSIPCPIPRSTKSSRARLSHIKSLCKPRLQTISPLARWPLIAPTKGKNYFQNTHEGSSDEQVTNHALKTEPNIKIAEDIDDALGNKSYQVNEASTEKTHLSDKDNELIVYGNKKNELQILKNDLGKKQSAIKEIYLDLKQLHKRLSNLGYNPGKFATDVQLEERSNCSLSDLKTFQIKTDNSEHYDLLEMLDYTQELMKTVIELPETSLQFCHEVIKNYSDAINWIRDAASNVDVNSQHVNDEISKWIVNKSEMDNLLLAITEESKFNLSEVQKSFENLSQKLQHWIYDKVVSIHKCSEFQNNINETEVNLDIQSNSLERKQRAEQDEFAVEDLDENSASSKSLQLISLEKEDIEGCFELADDGKCHHFDSETTMSTTYHTEKGVKNGMQSNDKIIFGLQKQISNLKTQLTHSENNSKTCRKKMKQIKSQKNRTEGHSNEHLYQEIRSLQFHLVEIRKQNENLSNEIANKNAIILKNEKDINEQHKTLNVREELIELLKLKEREVTEQMKNLQSSLTENEKNLYDINKSTPLNETGIEELCLNIKSKEADLDPVEKCISAIQKQHKHTHAKDSERDSKSAQRWRFGFY